MKLLAIDISGNFEEGKGTSGICIMEDDQIKLLELKATEFKRKESYWQSHLDFINSEKPNQIVVEGFRLYNHKGKKADMQTHSLMETPKLIGIIELFCYQNNIPLTIQFASEVKTRWSEEVLVRLGYLEEKNGRYYFDGKITSTHKRDSLKHGLHFERYKLKELKQ
jgi:hypothetical protein